MRLVFPVNARNSLKILHYMFDRPRVPSIILINKIFDAEKQTITKKKNASDGNNNNNNNNNIIRTAEAM